MGSKVLWLNVALLSFLMICEHVRAQCAPPSFPSRNVIMSESSLSAESFPDGSTVTFECDIGHEPVNSTASKNVTCERNQWTSLELECTKKSCGSPPEFHNGRYEIEGILFGNKITAVCDTGYILDGLIKDRWCRDQGWDGRDPICEDVCPKPEIPNAYRIEGRPPPYMLSNFIKYKCDNGYTMKGESQILCTENGWNPNPPKCIGPCSRPDFGRDVTLTEEFRMQKSFPYGSKVTFECIRGYEPVDSTVSKSVTCEENNWTKLLLTCKVVKCKAPPAIVNGQLEEEPLDSYDYLQAVSYKCSSGFSLIGSSTLRCSGDGTFKPDLPKCLAPSTTTTTSTIVTSTIVTSKARPNNDDRSDTASSSTQ